MTLEDNIKQLTDIVASLRAEIMQLKQSITAGEKSREIKGKRGLNMTEACKVYGKTYKTMRRRIDCGTYYAYKEGGEWVVECPEDRANRIQTNKTTNLWNN